MKHTIKIMFIGIAMATLSTGCKEREGKNMTESARYEDTAGLAQFQEWKARNERADASEYQNSAAAATRPADNVKKSVRASQPATNNSNSATSTQPAENEKKGWSKAAKGTAIGAGSGAVLGAVVNKKNRGAGAVIGGVIGGAAGYGVGRSKDKKDGRVEKRVEKE